MTSFEQMLGKNDPEIIELRNKNKEKVADGMTKLENIVMNVTGCDRQLANTVVNGILDEDRAQVIMAPFKEVMQEFNLEMAKLTDMPFAGVYSLYFHERGKPTEGITTNQVFPMDSYEDMLLSICSAQVHAFFKNKKEEEKKNDRNKIRESLEKRRKSPSKRSN